MAKIHGGQPGFKWLLNAATLCADKVDIEIKRDVKDSRTNCGNDKTLGFTETSYKGGGPLDFGAGLTEATLWAHIIATTAQAIVIQASTATVGAANPSYTGSVLGDSLKISLSANADAMFDFSGVETATSGLPTRAII